MVFLLVLFFLDGASIGLPQNMYITFQIYLMERDAKSIFTEHHTEIQRRGVVTHNSVTNSDTFERLHDGEQTISFKCPNQQWVLYSISHVGMAPVSTDPRNPALRIYGTFETPEDARTQAMLIAQSESCSLLISKTHEWIVAVRDTNHLSDSTATEAHIQKVIDAHQQSRRESSVEFDKNVADKHIPIPEKMDKQEDVEMSDGPFQPLGIPAATKLPRTLEVRDQAVAAVSFLCDAPDVPAPEFLFRVYSCFGSVQDADRYVRNCAGDHVKSFDVDVVSTCEWLHPQKCTTSDVSKEVYRSTELNSIMTWHKSQPKEVENFRRWRDNVD